MTTAGAVLVSIVLAGCGQTAVAPAIRRTIRAYVTALATHDVAAACAVITPAYWFATVDDINGARARLALPALARNDCPRALTSLFSGTRASSRAVSKVTLTDIRIDGDVATGHMTIGAAPRRGSGQNARFVKASSGGWRLDCCAGAQNDQGPTTTFRIISGSMEPTLKIGQYVITDDASTRSQPPTVGDIVVFHPPVGAESAPAVCGSPTQGAGRSAPCDVPTAAESREAYIKRVVALPGDRITIIAGHVIRNGVREQDAYALACSNRAAAECTFATPIVVPPGEYYMLGDNRGASDDSRFWGPVRRASIIGVVTQ